MKYELPYHILSQVGNNLSRHDIKECSLACSHWRLAFQSVLWEKFTIKNREQLDFVCLKIFTYDNVYLSHCKSVKTLVISDGLKISDEQFYILQQLFQNITVLTLAPETLASEDFGTLADWHLWKDLVDLSISAPKMGIPNSIIVLDEILSALPNLTKLTLSDGHSVDSMIYTWKDIEIIHDLLPQLKHLCLAIRLKTITDQEINQVQEIVAANNLIGLRIQVWNMSPQWLYYFVRKYPRVQKFTWQDARESGKSILDWSTSISIFSGLVYFFPHLKTLYLSGIPFADDTLAVVFWGLLCQFEVSIEELHYAIKPEEASFDQIVQPFDVIKFCALTLKTAVLSEFNRFTVNVEQITSIQYPALVDLCMHTETGVISIDNILDNCPSLNNLSLGCKAIEPITTTLDESNTHGLKQFCMGKGRVGSHLFSYLTTRCRDICTMVLKNIYILGRISVKTGEMCINMPYARFKKLEIYNTRFLDFQGVYNGEDFIAMGEATDIESRESTSEDEDEDGPYSQEGSIEDSDSTEDSDNTEENDNDDIPQYREIDIPRWQYRNLNNEQVDTPIERRTKKDYISLVALEQTDGTQSLGNFIDPDTLVEYEEDSRPAIRRNWYHYALDLNATSLIYTVRRLNIKEAKFAQKHFRSFQHRNSLLLDRYFTQNNTYGWVYKYSWKEDLIKGYVTIRCASVENIQLSF
ncbi:hypothetical protein CLU79DRAFT_733738 [Phycomyces nitens]|nr:hypothetical protein CLU79DRAFT_733738 [Phycomyces nitens]